MAKWGRGLDFFRGLEETLAMPTGGGIEMMDFVHFLCRPQFPVFALMTGLGSLPSETGDFFPLLFPKRSVGGRRLVRVGGVFAKYLLKLGDFGIHGHERRDHCFHALGVNMFGFGSIHGKVVP